MFLRLYVNRIGQKELPIFKLIVELIHLIWNTYMNKTNIQWRLTEGQPHLNIHSFILFNVCIPNTMNSIIYSKLGKVYIEYSKIINRKKRTKTLHSTPFQ